MFSPRTRVPILAAIAIAISWLPAPAAGQIKVTYASEAAVALAVQTPVTIAIEGAGFTGIRGVVVARDAAGRDVITEITGSFRGDKATGNLTLALADAAPPGRYYVFLTDGRGLAPVPVELTVASANEPPVVSGVLVDASAEPNQPFAVTVNAEDDHGLAGIQWEFAGSRGSEVLPPAKVGYGQTSATFTFELTTDLIGTHTLAVTAFDLDRLPSDVVEAFVTVEASTPPAEAPAIVSPAQIPGQGTVVPNGTPMDFEWTAVAGAEEYQWHLSEAGLVVEGNSSGTVSGLSTSILRTPIDGNTYNFAVRAVNAGGIGPLSENFLIGVQPQPLDQPTIITSYPAIDGQPDVATGESFTFAWTPVLNATSYEYCLIPEIEVWDGVGQVNGPNCQQAWTGGVAESGSTTSASFTRSALYPGTRRYSLTVRASRSFRRGPYSELASIVVDAPLPVEAFEWEAIPGPGGPGAPRILSYSGDWYLGVSAELHFEWEPLPGAYGYEYCVGSSLNSCSTLRELVGHTIFGATVFVGIQAGRCGFYFRVRTLDGQAGNGPWSNTIHGWTASWVDQCE